MTHDLDPRQAPDVVADLAAADAQARPVVARGAGVSNLAIVAGFGVMGVGLFLWMSSHRADAQPRPQRPNAAAAAAPAAAPAPVARGPLYAVPAPQFTVDNSVPIAAPPPPMSATTTVGPTDLAARRHAPALVVDFGGGERPATLIKAGADAGTTATAKSAELNADEQFADRVSLDEATPAKATAMRNLDAVVPQGAVIPAVMETAINSDLPGLARAMVTRDVKSFDGSTVLIPRGSRVIGQYKSGVALGASRVFVIWTRVIRPDGVTIQIGSPAADPLGRGGLEGKVDRHFFTRFGGSILMSVLNAGVAAVSNVKTNSQIYIGSATEAANLANSAKPSTTSPTIQTPQGAPVTIFVARDLDFSGVRNGA
ncbi:MAG: TrbI/VirB10 family protein [Caulobacter sp.]|nr:TrbI/VirB10 family protein [Caulobacter sp.]